MGLQVNSTVMTLRHERMQVTGYHRARIRNDKALSISAIGNGYNNPAGRAARDVIYADQGAIRTVMYDTQDPLAMWGKIRRDLAGIHGRLVDMRDLVAKVAAGGIVTGQVDIKISLFEAIKTEINGMLGESEHNGNQVLTSSDAVVSIDLSILDSVDLENAPDIAVALVDAAIEDIKQADETAQAKLLELTDELEALQSRAEQIDDHEAQLEIGQQAQSDLQSLLASLVRKLTKGFLVGQANVEPQRAVALLAGDTSSGGPTSSPAAEPDQSTDDVWA